LTAQALRSRASPHVAATGPVIVDGVHSRRLGRVLSSREPSRSPREPPRIGRRGMNPLDWYVLSFVNHFAHRSWTLDYFVMLLSKNYVLKTGLIIVMLGWLWARRDDRARPHRPIIVFGLVASVVGIALNRALAAALPFRVRPLRSALIDFVLPYGVNPNSLPGWSAFPSDNATLFFGLATCIFLVSRRAGIVAFCHVTLVVAFARIYLGFHHPTDILAGALLGVGLTLLVLIPAVREAVTAWPLRWLEQHPPSFHAALIGVLFLIAVTFEPLYDLAGFGVSTAQATLTVTRTVVHTIGLAAVHP
jgi:undecaprenyl-diphosphatase